MISEWELGNDFKKGNILVSFFLSTMNARVEVKADPTTSCTTLSA